MTKPSQSGFKRFFYNQNIKRDKSGKKYKNLINHYILLVRRVEKNGMDAWIIDALGKAKKKIIAYGIALYQIEAVMQQKGLDALIPLFHTTFTGEGKQDNIPKAKIKVDVVIKKAITKRVAKEENTEKEGITKVIKKTPVKKETKTTTVKKTTEKKAPVKKEAKTATVKKTTKTTK